MPLRHKRVDTTTIKGVEEAERLQAKGWRAIRVGLFSTLFEKKERS